MSRYDIKNPNGSLVFVRGVRVKPYAKFSATLDPNTARELTKYGVSLTQTSGADPVFVAPAPPPALVVEETLEAAAEPAEVVEEAAPEVAAEETFEEVPEETVVEETPEEAASEEAPVSEEVVEEAAPEEAPVSEEVVEEAAPEASVEEAPVAEEVAAEEAPASEEAPIEDGRRKRRKRQ